MSKFQLRQETIKIRGQDCVVRELTQAERTEIAKLISEDKFRGPALFASRGAVEPKLSEEECSNEPAEAINAIARKVMHLSGMGLDSDEESSPKS